MYNVSYRVVLYILVPQTLKSHMHTAESNSHFCKHFAHLQYAIV